MVTEVRPGEVLVEKLDEMGMTQAEFARRTGLSAKHVNRVVKGKATFGPEVAIRFERVTGVSARLWLTLQADYQLGQARLRA